MRGISGQRLAELITDVVGELIVDNGSEWSEQRKAFKADHLVALVELQRLRAGGWRSVADELPPVQTPVLGVIDFGKGQVRVDVVSRSGNTGEFRHGYRIIPKPPVTHWQPLPNPPAAEPKEPRP